MRDLMYMPDLSKLSAVKKALKNCKDEWLETKPGNKGGKFLGVNTVRQILDHAVEGVTYWDFGITKEWKEEVHKFDKNKNAWEFDGYVYHVRGYLMIAGIGHREQYGCKIAIGGKDNQDSAYKAAASNCLVKCSSMFGVGEEIYSKIKIETDDEKDYHDLQQQAQYKITTPAENVVYMNKSPQPAVPYDPKPVAAVAQAYMAQPVTYGQPVVTEVPKAQATPNDWDVEEMKQIHFHRERLRIATNDQFLIYIRDFLKKDQASLSDITPVNLKSFNQYLSQIMV